MSQTTLGIGIVGGGYMGKAHASAFAAVGTVFETRLKPKLMAVAASSADSAARYASAYGAERGAAHWQDLVEDPKVEAVVIASPQDTHREVAEAAFALGKPVLCEKPMGLDLADARAMVKAAGSRVNMVAYNYIRTPASQFARQLVADGTLGEIVHFRGEHVEDFHCEDGGAVWRLTGDANGCIGDLAPHIFNAALALMGPIDELNAMIETVHKERDGVTVTNDDAVQMMVRFKGGAMGHIAASRVAMGRKMGYAYEITGTKGAIRFDQEDQNALWLYEQDADPAYRGFRKILTGPAHPDYKPFCLGPGHGTGYQDQIIIEAHDFLRAIDGETPYWPTFEDGLAVHQIIAAARASDRARSWTRPDDY